MPGIDPLQLLITLGVLLGPDGGIKESKDIQRVVNLMIRYSKKLVSKCIYVQILLATKSDLLDDFYSHGGWALVTGWFTDASDRENWRLLEDMLRLFRNSPVSVERLKMNHCPKQVKLLSKEAQCDVVKDLAQEVVDMWMKVIKGEPGGKDKKKNSMDSEEQQEPDKNWKMEIRNGICIIKKVVVGAPTTSANNVPASPEESESVEEAHDEGDDGESVGESVGEARKASSEKEEVEGMEVDGEVEKGKTDKEDEEKKIVPEPAEKSPDPPVEVKVADTKSKEEDKMEDDSKSPRGKKREHSSSRSDSKSKRKSSDKSSEKGSDKSSSSKEKSKKSSSSKHSSKQSSRHHKSHKDHRDRHKSRESEKQREREKEKERERKKQSEKDKETLAKVQGQSLSLGKLGAIPKKKSTDSDRKASGSSGPVAVADASTVATKKPLLPTPGDRRPTTVKTFGAKFRSTGLEDVVSTAALPKRKPVEVVRPPPPPPPKRALAPEPLAAVSSADKRSRIEQRAPVERPGGIKVIPPKPLHLQEATGFMDALNASKEVAKRKNPKRTRRLSSREDSKEEKKVEPATTPTTPPTATPPAATSPAAAPPVAAKPLFKFYQDTQQDQEEEEKKETTEDKKSEAEAEKTDDSESVPKEEKESDEPEDEQERAPTPPTIPLERPGEEQEEMKAEVKTEEKAEVKADVKTEVKPEGKTDVKPEGKTEVKAEVEAKVEASSPPPPRPRVPGQTRGVLVYHRPASRRKLSVRWRPDHKLVDVSYFDLDENERVNVNRAKFMDMQAMEKINEREFLRRNRGSRDDGMAEQMAWQMLIVMDKPPPPVAAGSRSLERGIQGERDRCSLPAFLNPAKMPDTPNEPDPEHHERTPCKPVPLEDDQDGLTVKDYSADGWPEPQPEPLRPAMLPLPVGGGGGAGPPGGQQMMPQMMPPGLLPPPNWGPGVPMQPGMDGMMQPGMDGMMQPGMDGMMPPDLMSSPMGMMGPGGFVGPPHPMGPPGGGWGPIGPPMGPGGMMPGPGGMMGGHGGMGMMSGPGPRPPYGGGGYRGGGGGGGWRGGGEEQRERRPRHEVPCKHHLSGYCRKGMSCHFLHLSRNGGGEAPRGRGRQDDYV